MSDLRPMLGESPTEDEKRVLESARLDVPPRAGKSRAVAAMGLAAAMSAATGAGGAAAATTGAGLVVKWVTLGAVGGTLALGAAAGVAPLVRGTVHAPGVVAHPTASGVSHSSTGHPPALPVPPPAVLPAEPPPAPSADTTESSATPSPETPAPSPVNFAPQKTPRAPLANPLPPPAPAPQEPAAPTPTPRTTLAAEVDALDEARAHLAAGNPAATLRVLDAYERSFTDRRLAPEASVLRIEALLTEGRSAEARELGDRLLASEPDGAYAQRIRSLLSATRP